MRTLLAGGFVSELGWEVATWVPAIRRYSRKFDNTVIVCRTGYEYLYGDIADVIINYDKKGLPDRWLLKLSILGADISALLNSDPMKLLLFSVETIRLVFLSAGI